MIERNIESMEAREFETMMDRFVERDFEEMPVETFFDLLAQIDEEKKRYPLELEGDVMDGEASLALPITAVSGITVRGNEIVLDGERRIVIHLRQAGAPAGR